MKQSKIVKNAGKVILSKENVTTILSLIRGRVGNIDADGIEPQERVCLMILKEFSDMLLNKLMLYEQNRIDFIRIKHDDLIRYSLEWLLLEIDITDLDPFSFSTLKKIDLWN